MLGYWTQGVIYTLPIPSTPTTNNVQNYLSFGTMTIQKLGLGVFVVDFTVGSLLATFLAS